MKRLLSAVLVFGAMTGAAAAEPARLSDAQMDQVAAGRVPAFMPAVHWDQGIAAGPVNIVNITQISVAYSIAVGINLGGGANTVSSSAIASNFAFVNQHNLSGFRR